MWTPFLLLQASVRDRKGHKVLVICARQGPGGKGGTALASVRVLLEGAHMCTHTANSCHLW